LLGLTPTTFYAALQVLRSHLIKVGGTRIETFDLCGYLSTTIKGYVN
jgi:hypothetical protein